MSRPSADYSKARYSRLRWLLKIISTTGIAFVNLDGIIQVITKDLMIGRDGRTCPVGDGCAIE